MRNNRAGRKLEGVMVPAWLHSCLLLALLAGGFPAADGTAGEPQKLLLIQDDWGCEYRDARTGKVVIKKQYEHGGDFSEGLAPVCVFGKWGYIDTTGRLVIKPRFRSAGSFSEGLAVAALTNQAGYINKSGEFVIKPQFQCFRGKYPSSFVEGRAVVWRGDGGETPNSRDGKFGYIDREGKQLTEVRFDYASHFSEGLALVRLDRVFMYLDRYGKPAINCDAFLAAKPFSEGLALVGSTNGWGFIDKTGKLVISLKGYEADGRQEGSFAEGLARVEHPDGIVVYIDKTGREVIRLDRASEGYSFSDGLAPVSVKGKWGYMDKTGKCVIEPRFAQAGPFVGGLATVFTVEPRERESAHAIYHEACIDKSGKYLWGPIERRNREQRSEDEIRLLFVRMAIAALGQPESREFGEVEEMLKHSDPAAVLPLLKEYETMADDEVKPKIERIVQYLKSGTKAKEMELLKRLANAKVEKSEVLKSVSNGLFEVDLMSSKIEDISILRGMPINKLYLQGTSVSDLSPLVGAPLEYLVLEYTKVTDITPLKGMPLRRLSLRATMVTDLSPLKGMPLESLCLWQVAATNITPLAGMPLKEIYLDKGRALTGMDSIRGISSLTTINGRPAGEFWKDYDTRAAIKKRLDEIGVDYGFGERDGLYGLDLKGTNVVDLSVLKGMPLSHLSISSTNLKDLSPLEGMPLKQLRLPYRSKVDLSQLARLSIDSLELPDLETRKDRDILREAKTVRAINGRASELFWKALDAQRDAVAQEKKWSAYLDGKGMKYVQCTVTDQGGVLSLYGPEVKDLAPLKGMPVTRLILQSCVVTDLSPLAGMPLQSLWLEGMQTVGPSRLPVTNLWPLQGMPLKELRLMDTAVNDLSPLHGLPLDELNIYDTPVRDLSPIRDMSLVKLTVNGTKVVDLSAVKGMKRLAWLFCSNTAVSDLTPLEGLQFLNRLWVNKTAVRSLEPLTNMTHLFDLMLDETAVSDLTPVRGLPLGTFSIKSTKVADLSPLKGASQLYSLACDNTAVSDLSPLQGKANLQILSITNTAVLSLEPLKGLTALRDLQFSPERITHGMEVIRQMPSLRVINGMKPTEFWRKYDAGEFNGKK